MYAEKIQMNIGLLGYGTVGRGVYKQCLENGINVKYILVRDKNKKLDVDSILCEDINEIVNDKEIDTVVECIGGNNPAFDYASLVLKNKKNFVSANKKMLVTYLKEINDLALENNVSLLYSSACGGGIPVLSEIKRIENCDSILKISGIMNGTSNYILDRMYNENLDFIDVLKSAQELGYAEKDPSDDINGVDSANKLILASLLGFNKAFKLDDIFVSGIKNINKKDISYFKENGYKCVLLASATKINDRFVLKVVPSIFKNDIFSNISLNNNCFMVESKNLDKLYLIGQGAGSMPTASNVLKDLLVNDTYAKKIDDFELCDYDILPCAYYIRGSVNGDCVYKMIDENSYISKKISINMLRKIIKDDDFVCEVIDDKGL